MATAFRLDALDLPRIDPAQDALAGAVARLLEHAGFAVDILAAPPRGSWFACADGVQFRPGDAALHPERVAEAAAVLDAAEPLLLALEQALGLHLEPDAIDGASEAPVLHLALSRDDRTAALLLPCAHPHAGNWIAEAEGLTPPAARLPVVVRLLLQGPRLGIAEASDLAPGDLVLMGARPIATLEAPHFRQSGQVDLPAGIFTSHPDGAPMESSDAAPSPRDFAVPLTLRLPERLTSAAALADLRPGVALPLGPIAEGMPVELLVAGSPLARGELVQLGDRFAVLIESRVDLVEATVQQPAEVDA
ncbi:FliM/FliN family flagellar motor switch protein [Sphingomonas pituitosa]|uniref:FliM/FliN family flagellar motor switch protein n=1 Tax=Sphingomonas pituitosa TaxID=99597 RepID=UPI000833680D|nr:FliM/FliN family flagellar motor switch protein [Sphingomonas pituitosa]